MYLVEMSNPESAKRALMLRMIKAVLTRMRQTGIMEQVVVEMSCIPDNNISGDPEYIYMMVLEYIDWATCVTKSPPKWFNIDWVSVNCRRR